MLEFATSSEEETIALGARLAAEVLPRRGVVLLTGALGAGKTALAKGIVSGRGAAPVEEVASPTFTLIHEYGDPPGVYHADLYRIESERDAATLGIEELIDRDALVLVEWGERFPGLFPADSVRIEIERGSGEERKFRVERDSHLH